MSKSHVACEVSGALKRCRAGFLGVALLSGLINLLMLTGSFFMLEVYDRVLPSRSLPTLVGLIALALLLYAFQGGLEVLRGRILARTGALLDQTLGRRVLEFILRAPLRTPLDAVPSDATTLGEGLLPLRDLDTLRAFLSGSGPGALFDLPWIPVYLAICFLFHPLIGAAALAMSAVLAAIAVLSEHATRDPLRASTAHGATRLGLAEAARRNAEAVAALGMRERLIARWCSANGGYGDTVLTTSDRTGLLSNLARTLRTALQSGVLAIGAWLVIRGEATGGIIVAASILVSRALAPAELTIANWKGIVAARQAWGRLAAGLARIPPEAQPHRLPAPVTSVSVEDVSLVLPGTGRCVLQGATFSVVAGQGLGIIGPSASGKSSLTRAIVGVWPPMRGTVRLDGASLDQWTSASLGPHLGYLSQEVALFAGTIAENIARFEPEPPPEAVVAAARAAGVHELILRLPRGYDTALGEGGTGLSAGQRQRIGLARALYRDPFLVVLDEPNANLDAEGELALTRAILGVRLRGGICIVVAHRPSALAGVDLVLAIADGRVRAFGPKDQVLARVLKPGPVPDETGSLREVA